MKAMKTTSVMVILMSLLAAAPAMAKDKSSSKVPLSCKIPFIKRTPLCPVPKIRDKKPLSCRIPIVRNTPFCPDYNRKQIDRMAPRLPMPSGSR
jgi:hypothetical protein